MAVEVTDTETSVGEHVVQLYESDSELIRMVCPYLAAGARSGEAVIVIAGEPHRQMFEAELEAEGIDLAQASVSEAFVSLDSSTTMAAAFVADGQIDRDAFHEVIGGLLHKATESGRAVRAYGDMVALLWEGGDVLAAIEAETLWNDLAGELPFSLFCSYPARCVSGHDHAETLQMICDLHSSVLPGSVGGQDVDDRRLIRHAVEAEFPAERESPGQARRLLVASLQAWGYGGTLLDDAALVLDELASNAVVHTGSPFSIAGRLEGSVLRISVKDASRLATIGGEGMIPRPTHGLALIDTLSSRWGVESTPKGKIVWAELPL